MVVVVVVVVVMVVVVVEAKRGAASPDINDSFSSCTSQHHPWFVLINQFHPAHRGHAHVWVVPPVV